MLPVALVAVQDGGGDGGESVVADVEAEVDNVLEHLVEAGRQRADVRVPDCQQQLVVVLHPLEGLQGDRPQRARDLDLLQLGPEGPEQLVRENVRGLQDLGLERLEGGEAGDDGAKAELELLYLRPALDVEGGEVGQLGQRVRVEPLEVGQVVHHEALQPVEAVEALLGEDPDGVEGDVEAGEQGDEPPAVCGQRGQLVVGEVEVSELRQGGEGHQVQRGQQVVREVQPQQAWGGHSQRL